MDRVRSLDQLLGVRIHSLPGNRTRFPRQVNTWRYAQVRSGVKRLGSLTFADPPATRRSWIAKQAPQRDVRGEGETYYSLGHVTPKDEDNRLR